jgi:hypothetical protein
LALPPNSNEAFLREVDEELRRDQLTGFWEQWGRWLIGAIVLALAAFAGFLYWQHSNEQAAGVEGEKLQVAYDSLGANNVAAAAVPLAQIAGSKRDGYRTLAKFTQADILLQKNDLKGAAATLGEIAQDASLAQPFRDLALVRQTAAEYDGLKPQVVVERLRPLAVAGNSFFGSAGEMVAMAYLRMNRRDLAGTLFGQIARNDDVPDTIRQRAVQMAGVLGVDAVAQNQESKAQ